MLLSLILYKNNTAAERIIVFWKKKNACRLQILFQITISIRSVMIVMSNFNWTFPTDVTSNSLVRRQKSKYLNEDNKKKTSTKFSEKEIFLPPDMRKYVCILGGKKYSFFIKLFVFVFLLPLFWYLPFCVINKALYNWETSHIRL